MNFNTPVSLHPQFGGLCQQAAPGGSAAGHNSHNLYSWNARLLTPVPSYRQQVANDMISNANFQSPGAVTCVQPVLAENQPDLAPAPVTPPQPRCIRPCTREQYLTFRKVARQIRGGGNASILAKVIPFTRTINKWSCGWTHGCGRTLSTNRKALARHFGGKSHQGQVVCRWGSCNKELRAQGLSKHLLETHLKQDECVCLLCGTVASRVDALVRHIRVDCRALEGIMQGIGDGT
ncbi:hypothetical protein CERSUDRAFT_77752 [Gelatoporia subvermispora B]|uniref:C2H2-type domain-containing protein n=1 Tax=Ceriporiopsis subvermispora (strain B) TaxID=914234 RepID=M2QII0_CERS8|nr:hypothetical protein CERSUDRAFT_77752 [Gelatoporia subvermispora B]